MPLGVASAPALARHRAPYGELAVKLRVSHLVESADFEPAELSPAALLIVRRLRDPLPRGLSMDKFALAATHSWEQAARSALAKVARSAARPSREAVPSNANAVWFADQAELLACFSRDYLRGEAASFWWWRAMLRLFPGAGSRGLFNAWLHDIRYVPAAIALLTSLGDVNWVVRSFTPEQAKAILQEIARAFDLPHVLAVAENPLDSRDPRAAPDEGFGRLAPSLEDSFPNSRKRDEPVLRSLHGLLKVDAVSVELSCEHTTLIIVSLALCKSAGVVRSRAFAADLQRWWQAASRGSTTEVDVEDAGQPLYATFDETDTHRKVVARDEGSLPTIAFAATSYDWQPPEPARPSMELTVDAHPEPPGRIAGPQDESSPNLPRTVEPRNDANQEAKRDRSLSPQDEVKEHETVPDYVPSLISGEISESSSYVELSEQPSQSCAIEAPKVLSDVKLAVQAGDYIATEICGLFFLVNLMRVLRIPQVLEQECDCEFGLGSWEWLELIARSLLGPNLPELAGDPVWSLLSILDGRPPEQSAGKDFRPAALYRLPQSWIPEELTDATTAGVRVHRDRFEIWTSLGFPLTSSSFDDALSAQDILACAGGRSLSSFRRMPRYRSGTCALGARLEMPLQIFLAFLMPYLRWRLAASLGLARDSRPDLAKLLLLRTGKVWMTATHVDVVMPLKQATSAVRLAGLDTDPGWVGDFGRVIKFYFQ